MDDDVEHRLRNYLAIVLGYANLLLEDLPAEDPKRQDVLEIQQATERAIELLRRPAPSQP